MCSTASGRSFRHAPLSPSHAAAAGPRRRCRPPRGPPAQAADPLQRFRQRGAPDRSPADAKTPGAALDRPLVERATQRRRDFAGKGEAARTEPRPAPRPASGDLLVSRNAKGRFAGEQIPHADHGGTRRGRQVAVTIKLAASGRERSRRSPRSPTRPPPPRRHLRHPGTLLGRHTVARIVYGGATSQSEPIVLRLDAARKRVNDVITTWNARAATRALRVARPLVNFAVKRTGRFGNPFIDDSTDRPRNQVPLRLRVAGRVPRPPPRARSRSRSRDLRPARSRAATPAASPGRSPPVSARRSE